MDIKEIDLDNISQKEVDDLLEFIVHNGVCQLNGWYVIFIGGSKGYRGCMTNLNHIPGSDPDIKLAWKLINKLTEDLLKQSEDNVQKET